MWTNSLKKRGFIASLLLVMYCTIGFIGPQGFVLCLGQDGHIAIESASIGVDCGFDSDQSAVAERPHLAKDIRVPESHCGSCSDAALGLFFFRIDSNRDQGYLLADSIFVVMPSIFHDPVTLSAAADRWFDRDSRSAFPLLLRTSILLI